MARIADRKENQPVFASVRCPVHGLEHIFLVRKLLMAANRFIRVDAAHNAMRNHRGKRRNATEGTIRRHQKFPYEKDML